MVMLLLVVDDDDDEQTQNNLLLVHRLHRPFNDKLLLLWFFLFISSMIGNVSLFSGSFELLKSRIYAAEKYYYRINVNAWKSSTAAWSPS